MLTKKNNIKELQKQLVNNTEVVSVAIFFGEKDQVGIQLTEGKVLYTVPDRVYWKSPYKKKRTLSLSSFGQLVPGLNFNQVTFYGLFFKPNNMEYFYKELSVLAKKLRTEIIRNVMMLNFAIDKIDVLAEGNKHIKLLPYLEWKYNRKYGNGSWQRRPYWDAKNDSYFDMWKLNFRNGKTLEERRADRIIYKKIKAKNWNGQKQYPKLYKKFIDNTTTEYKVLKKDKWKV